MKVSLFINATILDATQDMILSIDKKDFSQEHIIVVPDKYSLQAEKAILQNLGDSLFNVRVLGLTKLANEILKEMGVKSDTVSEMESLLLTQKAIDEVAENFKVFRKGDFGFCQEMHKLIGQLKSSCVEKDDLAIQSSGLSGSKYHDIKLVLEKYNELLGGRLDANEKLLLASKFAGEKSLKNKHFYFGYFEAFTAEGYALLETLISFAESLSFSCAQSVSIGNDYLYEKDIKEKVTKIAIQKGASISVKKGKGDFSKIKNALLRGVLSYEKIKCENNGFFSVFGARDREEEVDFTAKTIFYLLHRGYKYRDIGIYVSDLSKYEAALSQIFSKYDFVYFIDKPISAQQTLIARAINALFNVVRKGYQKEDLISLFQNPVFSSYNLVEQVLKRDISGKRGYKIYLSQQFPADWFFEEQQKCHSTKEYVKLIDKLLVGVENNFDDFWREQSQDYLKEESINRQAFKLIRDCLVLLEKYDSIISCEEFAQRLEELLKMTDLSSPPTYVDGLSIGDATNSSMETKQIVFILGGESLPCQVSEGGLLSDEELKANSQKEISPTIRMINRRNRFKLFSLLSTAKERLIITCQTLNDEGKKIELPSYIKSLNEIFSQREEKLSFFLEGGTLSRNGFLLSVGSRQDLLQNHYRHLSQKDREELGIQLELSLNRDENRVNLSLDAEKLFFPDGRFSASQLETYFSCPFKHFVRYGLNIKEKEQRDFSPVDVGNICHKMAEIYVRHYLAGDNCEIRDFVNVNFYDIIKTLDLKEKFDECQDKKQVEIYLKNYLISFLRDVDRELIHSSLKPLSQEKFVSNISLAGLTLKGRADRVDQGGGYFKIIDYKTGKTKDILKELYFGNKLQLFLYANAIQEESKLKVGGVFYFNAKFEYAKSDEDKKLLKGLARNDENLIPLLDYDIDLKGKSDIISIEKSTNAKRGLYKGRALADEEFEIYQNYALRVAEQGLKEIKEGFVQPKPCLGACERCSYRGICLYSEEKGRRLTNDKIEF